MNAHNCPPGTLRRVIIESPYGAKHPDGTEDLLTVARNRRYLQRCILDCLTRGESPYASHQMLTDALRDADPEERALGIEAGFAWAPAGEVPVAVYVDYGVSPGMRMALNRHEAEGREVVFRCIGGNEQ